MKLQFDRRESLISRIVSCELLKSLFFFLMLSLARKQRCTGWFLKVGGVASVALLLISLLLL
jgi:hypothetical protein